MTAMHGTQTILTVNEVEESLENSCKYGIPKKRGSTAEMCAIRTKVFVLCAVQIVA